MLNVIFIILFLILSYIIGSIPFSHIFPKMKGVDVRQAGSGNVGATNALVTAGPLPGILALIGDLLKGFLPVFLAGAIFKDAWPAALAGLAAIVGHDFSLFLNFKGGKGVSTTAGALFALDPLFTVVAILLWVLVVFVTRYFIFSTLIVLGGIPVLMLAIGQRPAYLFFSLAALGLALYVHRADIQHLMDGREVKVDEALQKFFK